jgi:ferredoxin--NADP+ reductase
MTTLASETVLSVHHWNDTLFSFRTTRSAGLRFINGQFVMIGLEVEGKPADPRLQHRQRQPRGTPGVLQHQGAGRPVTSRLQHLKPGDPILVSKKPTGTLVLHDLKPGKRLFMFATGTGLAPFMSLIHDPETYERFEKVILIHGVRWTSELAYRDYIEYD